MISIVFYTKAFSFITPDIFLLKALGQHFTLGWYLRAQQKGYIFFPFSVKLFYAAGARSFFRKPLKLKESL